MCAARISNLLYTLHNTKKHKTTIVSMSQVSGLVMWFRLILLDCLDPSYSDDLDQFNRRRKSVNSDGSGPVFKL